MRGGTLAFGQMSNIIRKSQKLKLAYLRVVNVGRCLVVLAGLGIAGAAKGGVVAADDRLVPRQPPAILVPLAVLALARQIVTVELFSLWSERGTCKCIGHASASCRVHRAAASAHFMSQCARGERTWVAAQRWLMTMSAMTFRPASCSVAMHSRSSASVPYCELKLYRSVGR